MGKMEKMIYKPTELELDYMNALQAATVVITRLEQELQEAKEAYELLKFAFENDCLAK